MIRVLALYHKGKQMQPICRSPLNEASSDRRLSIVLYTLLVVEAIIKAVMSSILTIQAQGTKCFSSNARPSQTTLSVAIVGLASDTINCAEIGLPRAYTYLVDW